MSGGTKRTVIGNLGVSDRSAKVGVALATTAQSAEVMHTNAALRTVVIILG